MVYANTNASHRRSHLLYVNGVEIPCESANVSFGTWRFPEISVELPPDRRLYRMGADDKLQAALFYLDTHAYAKPTYCLLAEGEVVTWGYRRTGNSRHISMQAVDPLATLTQLFLFYLSDISQAFGNTPTKNKSDAILSNIPGRFFYKTLNTGDKGQIINRPVDLLLNAIGSVSGTINSIPVYSRRTVVVNALKRSQATVTGANPATGQQVYDKAKATVGQGVPSIFNAEAGPTRFSNPGLIRYAINSAGNIQAPGTNAQELYNWCKGANTLVSTPVGEIAVGGLVQRS